MSRTSSQVPRRLGELGRRQRAHERRRRRCERKLEPSAGERGEREEREHVGHTEWIGRAGRQKLRTTRSGIGSASAKVHRTRPARVERIVVAQNSCGTCDRLRDLNRSDAADLKRSAVFGRDPLVLPGLEPSCRVTRSFGRQHFASRLRG